MVDGQHPEGIAVFVEILGIAGVGPLPGDGVRFLIIGVATATGFDAQTVAVDGGQETVFLVKGVGGPEFRVGEPAAVIPDDPADLVAPVVVLGFRLTQQLAVFIAQDMDQVAQRIVGVGGPGGFVAAYGIIVGGALGGQDPGGFRGAVVDRRCAACQKQDGKDQCDGLFNGFSPYLVGTWMSV